MSDPCLSGKRVRVRIRRQDGPGAPARWEEFEIPTQPNTNVISCLMHIASRPVTVDGVPTTPPVWESGCLEELCGACTMLINGRPHQACSALVEKYTAGGEPIILEPLSKFPVVRDLLVDRQRVFDDLKRIKAWVPMRSTNDSGPGPAISMELQERLYDLSRCISCCSCLEVCPQYTPVNNFVGAAIFSQALRFNIHPGHSKLKDKRLDALMGKGGISECSTTGNCGQICPKGLSHPTSIEAIGRQVRTHALKRMKTRRR